MKKLIVCISLIGFIGLFYLFNNEEYSNKIAVMIEKNGTYEESNKIPTKGYELNKEKSICSNVEDISYSNNKLTLSNLSKDKTSCYLYFDETKSGKVLKELGLESNGETNNFDGTACGDSSCTYQENGVYEVEDDFGTSYYFRGTIDNNWVKFGKDSEGKDIWWRIIRINGDGTIRLIYVGTGDNVPDVNEDATDVITNQNFNAGTNDNMYVGYEYQSGQVHGNGTKSNALTQLNTWFSTNLADEFAEGNGRIDKNAGFCNDRSNSTNKSASWLEKMIDTGGAGGTTTYYGAYLRLANGLKLPTLKCSTNDHKDQDYFTYTGATGIKQNRTSATITGTKSLDYPVGLITADEVAFLGGVWNVNNTGYWLYTGKEYWTMSPSAATVASVVRVNSSGSFLSWNNVFNSSGLRPVINLKADTQFTGHGVADDPYVVKEAN